MKEILMNILYIIITGCGTAIATYLCNYLKQRTSTLTDNELVKTATDIVDDIVITVSQTYVDALRKSGTFTKEAQVEAKTKALELVENLITNEGKAAVTKLYGDFDVWVSTQIESAVKKNKYFN